MSRRDTIIVAVLVNAGLLIVLFASALKSSAPGDEFAAVSAPVIQEASEMGFKKETPPVVGDEVDHALSQFSQNVVAVTPPAQEIQPQAPEPVHPVSGFADDLKLIAVQETPMAPPAIQEPGVHTLTAPVAPKSGPEFTEVKVKKGDVLEKIARQHHSTVSEIMRANKMSSTNLRIGQVLKIPVKSIRKADISTISNPTRPAGSNSESGAKYYTVAKGDNPWTIAVKNHLKVEDLLRLNKMNEDQARRLKPGDQIRIQ